MRINCRFQIIILGQHLHETPYQKLESFGIFNGNRIVLVGEKVCEIKTNKFCF
jgi:hypothetical protein